MRALLISSRQQLLIYHPVFHSILIPAREEFSLPPLTRAGIPTFREERIFMRIASLRVLLITIQSHDYDRLTYHIGACAACSEKDRIIQFYVLTCVIKRDSRSASE
jgi:hypothetical protein